VRQLVAMEPVTVSYSLKIADIASFVRFVDFDDQSETAAEEDPYSYASEDIMWKEIVLALSNKEHHASKYVQRIEKHPAYEMQSRPIFPIPGFRDLAVLIPGSRD